MRFIFNFFFFGILFYIIYLFFPEAFYTLTSWADKTFAFLRDLFMQASEKIHSLRRSPSSPPPQHVFLFPLWFFIQSKLSIVD